RHMGTVQEAQWCEVALDSFEAMLYHHPDDGRHPGKRLIGSHLDIQPPPGGFFMPDPNARTADFSAAPCYSLLQVLCLHAASHRLHRRRLASSASSVVHLALGHAIHVLSKLCFHGLTKPCDYAVRNLIDQVAQGLDQRDEQDHVHEE